MAEKGERRKSSRIEQEHPLWYELDILQYRDQQLGYLITGERGTIFDWDKFKWSPTEPGEEGIVSTASGNDYYIYAGRRNTYIVNTRESERTGRFVGAAQPTPAQLPPIVFGTPWRIPGFYTTTEVERILLGSQFGAVYDGAMESSFRYPPHQQLLKRQAVIGETLTHRR
jgi:hypothetical protein